MSLSFRIAGVPIRIHAVFFLTAVMLGSWIYRNPATLGVWTGVVLFSVLWHELGHAFMGRAFGLSPQIDLHGMGGTTTWQANKKLSAPRRILISLAGPLMGIALGIGLLFVPEPAHPLAIQLTRDLLYVNLGWSIFNLVPMLPLDGGNVMAAALGGLAGSKGIKAARIISIVLAGALVVYAIPRRDWWLGILGALFAFQNFQALRREDLVANDAPLAERLQRAVEALSRDEGEIVVQEVEPVVAQVKTPELRVEAFRLLAFGYAAAQRWAQLVSLLRGEGGPCVSVSDLEELEGRATALGLHEVAKDLSDVRKQRELTAVSGEFRA
jgi:Zn-dependent protease